jgi:ADP-ribosyl-[dinitrogen reductase] hydrolase
MSNALFQKIQKRFEGCIIGGAIGDAWGSPYEGEKKNDSSTTFFLAPKKQPEYEWNISDDTQLTLVTCEAIAENNFLSPEILASKFLNSYRAKRFSGLGASTLKALRELEMGGHWSQVGRSGEYAAGNGAAMRIAPFAFKREFSRNEIRDFCRITHKNDEAYVGALAVVLAIRAIMDGALNSDINFLELIIKELPDTRVKDRLIEIKSLETTSTSDVANLGVTGFVVDSVPFAIFAASQIRVSNFETVLNEVISAGGDTDTNASIAGQIAGSWATIDKIPADLLNKLRNLKDYSWIKQAIDKLAPLLPDK